MELSPKQIEEINKQMDALVSAAVVKKVDEYVAKSLREKLENRGGEYEKIIRARIEEVFAMNSEVIRQNIQTWLEANLDRLVGHLGDQVFEQITSTIKRRILGRDDKA